MVCIENGEVIAAHGGNNCACNTGIFRCVLRNICRVWTRCGGVVAGAKFFPFEFWSWLMANGLARIVMIASYSFCGCAHCGNTHHCIIVLESFFV